MSYIIGRRLLASHLPGILLLALVAASASAQPATDNEEVIVIENLTLAELEEQIELVEDDMIRLFNASNDRNGSQELNIECRREVPTGTHFPVRICEPVFLTMARVRNNRDYAADLDRQLTPQQLQALVADQMRAMNDAYAKLLREDPIFAEVVGILTALQARQKQLQ